MGGNSLRLVNRPLRTRMMGGVGAAGEKPAATRLEPVVKILFLHWVHFLMNLPIYTNCYNHKLEPQDRNWIL